MTPPTIKEDKGRFTVENARPVAMRVGIAVFATVVLAFVVWKMIDDAMQRHFFMFAVRGLFAAMVSSAAVFALFGAETLAVEGGELVWRRGKGQERRCAISAVERVEQQGIHLYLHVRGQERPIVVGAGLRQPPPAMTWLKQRLEALLRA
jgi:hypothetical protein